MLTELKNNPRSRDNQNNKSMDDIEQSLIKTKGKVYCGIDDFEKVFERKKVIGDAID